MSKAGARLPLWKSPAARPLFVLCASTLLFIGIYAQTTSFEYVWDDFASIRDSKELDRPWLETARTTEHARMDPTFVSRTNVIPAHESFRPLLYLTYHLEVRAFGHSARAMHLTNVVLGALGILIAFVVARRLFRDPLLGAVVAAIFALHPLHTEPICYVSARADVLSGLLALSALGLALWSADLREENEKKLAAAIRLASCAVFLAALFVKEGPIGMPLALLAGAFLIEGRRAWLAPAIALTAMIPAYAVLRSAILSSHAPAALAQSKDATAGLVALPGIVLEQASLFLLPHDLSIARPVSRGWTYAGLAAAAVAIVALVVFARRHRRSAGSRSREKTDESGLAWFGVIFALATTGPAAIVAVVMDTVADRYAYLPVFGFAISGVVLARKLYVSRERLQRVLAFAGIAWCVLVTFATLLQVTTWHDETTLYAAAVDAEPESSIAHYDVGFVAAKRGHWEEAIPELERSLALDPRNDRAANNLGVAYMNVGRFEDAARVFTTLLAHDQGLNYRAHYNLATVDFKRGKLQEGCEELRKAIAINPSYAQAQRALAACN